MQSSKKDEPQLTEEERQRLREFFELLIEADRNDNSNNES